GEGEHAAVAHLREGRRRAALVRAKLLAERQEAEPDAHGEAEERHGRKGQREGAEGEVARAGDVRVLRVAHGRRAAAEVRRERLRREEWEGVRAHAAGGA